MHVEDAFLHIKIDSESDPVLVSVRGDEWGLLKNGLDVEVTLRPWMASAVTQYNSFPLLCRCALPKKNIDAWGQRHTLLLHNPIELFILFFFPAFLFWVVFIFPVWVLTCLHCC